MAVKVSGKGDKMKKGDIVLLKDIFSPSLEWPAMYSFYEVAGTVKEIYDFNKSALVAWNNYIKKAYAINSLMPIPDNLLGAIYYECYLNTVGEILSKHNSIDMINVPDGDNLFITYCERAVEVGARLYLRPGDSQNDKLSLVKLIIPQSVAQYKSIW